MNIGIQAQPRLFILQLHGRLDAVGAKELQEALSQQVNQETLGVVLDFAHVDYLSSAGLRTLSRCQTELQTRGGSIALSAMPAYCGQVLELTGYAGLFPHFSTQTQALAHCQTLIQEKTCLEHWDQLEAQDTPMGNFRFLPATSDQCAVEILGDIKDVLYARLTESHLCSKRFCETEYSIGLGGLGDRVDDYFGVMGEMITIGGTFVWLPTDGNDTPDFLIPKTDTGAVLLRTGFNTALAGRFNELLYFVSSQPEGTSISQLYREIFDFSKQRRRDYLGVLGLALRAEMATVMSTSVTKSPILPNAPANGKMIVEPENFLTWFEVDSQPRHREATALVCGLGADLTMDLEVNYQAKDLNRVFYLNPANVGSKTEMLHNHAVLFSPLPMPPCAANLDAEIKCVVEEGEFIDMRHLLDSSQVRAALIGVCYIQEFRSDPRGQAWEHTT